MCTGLYNSTESHMSRGPLLTSSIAEDIPSLNELLTRAKESLIAACKSRLDIAGNSNTPGNL